MRNSLIYTVADEGRDKGKAFLLTEMPASKSERWAIRALLAMAKSGIDLPEGAEHMGFAGIARLGLGLLLKVPYEMAEPLLDEMMECVQAIPTPSRPDIVRYLIEDDIEEIKTRFKLRKEVFELHANFSSTGAPSITESAAPAAESAGPSNITIRPRR
jgi:hypothetical protein